ncbi:MAG: Na-translocating system protein MpsC family protein [Cyanobacteria bacterium J06592_8]
MTDLDLQSKQLQTLLTQKIHALYEQQLNHQLSEVICKTFDNTIVIVMQGVSTRPEQLLTEFDHQELAEEMRQVLDHIIQPQIRQIKVKYIKY